jgi:hypothetical protein
MRRAGRDRISLFEAYIDAAALRGLGRLVPVWVRCQLAPSWGRSGWRRWPGELLEVVRTWAWVAVICDPKPSAWEVLRYGVGPCELETRPLGVDVRRVRVSRVEAHRRHGPRLVDLVASSQVRWAGARGRGAAKQLQQLQQEVGR